MLSNRERSASQNTSDRAEACMPNLSSISLHRQGYARRSAKMQAAVMGSNKYLFRSVLPDVYPTRLINSGSSVRRKRKSRIHSSSLNKLKLNVLHDIRLVRAKHREISTSYSRNCRKMRIWRCNVEYWVARRKRRRVFVVSRRTVLYGNHLRRPATAKVSGQITIQ